MRKAITLTLTFLLIVVTAVGIAIGVWLYRNRKSGDLTAKVTINGETQQTLSANLPNLTPGDSSAYEVILENSVSGEFSVTLDFQSTGETSLAPFVDVEIFLGKDSVKKAGLQALLEGERVGFTVDFSTQPQTLKIVYSIDESIENEAEDTVANFQILLTATK